MGWIIGHRWHRIKWVLQTTGHFRQQFELSIIESIYNRHVSFDKRRGPKTVTIWESHSLLSIYDSSFIVGLGEGAYTVKTERTGML